MPCTEVQTETCTSEKETAMQECAQEEDQGYEACAAEEDQGYEACAAEEDQGYEACAAEQDQGWSECGAWADQGYSKCCNWKPCSWFCDALVWVSSWVCQGWVWISNVVCVAWTWVSSWVCVAWTWVSSWVCVAWTWVSNVVCVAWSTLTHVVCVGWEYTKKIVCEGWEGMKWGAGLILNGAAFVVLLVFMIPGVGPLLRWVWDAFLTLFWGVLSVFDVGLCALGVCPRKKLRLQVIVMVGERNTPMVDPALLQPHVQQTVQIYRELADVDVVPLKDARSWVVASNTPASGPHLLDVSCGAEGFVKDLGIVGPDLDLQANVNGFDGAFRRLIGYGAPVFAFYVRTIDGGDGCSLGPLSDHVTVETQPTLSDALPHEIGHACGLWHVDDAQNLMNTSAAYLNTTVELLKWQKLLLRASRHVTYV
ncbi:MAG TPA: hypothetical protein VHG28_06740 [Longimicrobiaceae bacterium]|nr:hypothetical protein [Longimicrobiaceae bacterium]